MFPGAGFDGSLGCHWFGVTVVCGGMVSGLCCFVRFVVVGGLAASFDLLWVGII